MAPRLTPIPLVGRVDAEDLPGDCTGAQPVMVGIQRRADVEQLVPASQDSARFHFDLGVVLDEEGTDFRGPYVHGRRGDRFLYLVWGHTDDDGSFARFARSKLMFSDMAPDTLQVALDDPGARLVCVVCATNDVGQPASGTLRPPRAEWAAEAGTATS